MDDKVKYNFDKSTSILYKYYIGSITIEDISSSWDYAIANNIIPKDTKGFILDYTKANFDIKLNEVDKIPEYYKKHLNIFGNKKVAIITQTPKDIVFPILVEKQDSGYSSHPFYTLEAAVEWVLS